MDSIGSAIVLVNQRPSSKKPTGINDRKGCMVSALSAIKFLQERNLGVEVISFTKLGEDSIFHFEQDLLSVIQHCNNLGQDFLVVSAQGHGVRRHGEVSGGWTFSKKEMKRDELGIDESLVEVNYPPKRLLTLLAENVPPRMCFIILSYHCYGGALIDEAERMSKCLLKNRKFMIQTSCERDEVSLRSTVHGDLFERIYTAVHGFMGKDEYVNHEIQNLVEKVKIETSIEIKGLSEDDLKGVLTKSMDVQYMLDTYDLLKEKLKSTPQAMINGVRIHDGSIVLVPGPNLYFGSGLGGFARKITQMESSPVHPIFNIGVRHSFRDFFHRLDREKNPKINVSEIGCIYDPEVLETAMKLHSNVAFEFNLFRGFLKYISTEYKDALGFFKKASETVSTICSTSQ